MGLSSLRSVAVGRLGGGSWRQHGLRRAGGSGRLRGPTAPSAPALQRDTGDDAIQVEKRRVVRAIPGRGAVPRLLASHPSWGRHPGAGAGTCLHGSR